MQNVHLNSLADQIKQWGKALGFEAIGIADTDLTQAEQFLFGWLATGYHGQMQWMASHGNKRSRPADLIPGTVRIISDIRVTLLFEEKSTKKASYRRMSEIGMTRAGSRLASGSSGERQCIVTGGLGTMKVSFEGKTYYVCCEGCKQAFDADPKGTIEAYRERLKEAAK